MALSRSARRAIAKKRALEKSYRIAKAAKAYDLAKVREIVSQPKRHRVEQFIDATGAISGGYGYGKSKSCLTDMASQSHRGYVCRASGSMSKRTTDALRNAGKL